jgi:hypothetical protein
MGDDPIVLRSDPGSPLGATQRDLDRAQPRDIQYSREYRFPGSDKIRTLRTPNFARLHERMRNIDIKRRAERGRRFIGR